MSIKRKPFDMTNPYGYNGREVRVTANSDVLDYLKSLPYVMFCHIFAEAQQAIIEISPLYDVDEAWLTICEELEEFCNRVELDESIWGDALTDQDGAS
jgi:hypothetical protein